MSLSDSMIKSGYFVPLLTSQAGQCLTMDNWRQLAISAGIFSIEALITKPGIDVLRSYHDLREYTGWYGQIILYVGTLPHAGSGDYLIRSPYDGARITLTQLEMASLIQHLQADEVLQLAEKPDLQDWILACDQPGVDAMQGVIYHQEEPYSILDMAYAQQFLPLAQDCACPTCGAGLTRAYLHHLLQHTPLLAQRFLMMHNVFQVI